MSLVCRLCLDLINPEAENFHKSTRGRMSSAHFMAISIFPRLDMDITQQPCICHKCNATLEYLKEFTLSCNEVENQIKKFVEDNTINNNEKVDLKLIVAKTTEDSFVCRTCLKVMKHESEFSQIDMNNVERLCPKIKWETTDRPIFCNGCEDKFKNMYSFEENCLKIQNLLYEKLKLKKTILLNQDLFLLKRQLSLSKKPLSDSEKFAKNKKCITKIHTINSNSELRKFRIGNKKVPLDKPQYSKLVLNNVFQVNFRNILPKTYSKQQQQQKSSDCNKNDDDNVVCTSSDNISQTQGSIQQPLSSNFNQVPSTPTPSTQTNSIITQPSQILTNVPSTFMPQSSGFVNQFPQIVPNSFISQPISTQSTQTNCVVELNSQLILPNASDLNQFSIVSSQPSNISQVSNSVQQTSLITPNVSSFMPYTPISSTQPSHTSVQQTPVINPNVSSFVSYTPTLSTQPTNISQLSTSVRQTSLINPNVSSFVPYTPTLSTQPTDICQLSTSVQQTSLINPNVSYTAPLSTQPSHISQLHSSVPQTTINNPNVSPFISIPPTVTNKSLSTETSHQNYSLRTENGKLMLVNTVDQAIVGPANLILTPEGKLQVHLNKNYNTKFESKETESNLIQCNQKNADKIEILKSYRHIKKNEPVKKTAQNDVIVIDDSDSNEEQLPTLIPISKVLNKNFENIPQQFPFKESGVKICKQLTFNKRDLNFFPQKNSSTSSKPQIVTISYNNSQPDETILHSLLTDDEEKSTNEQDKIKVHKNVTDGVSEPLCSNNDLKKSGTVLHKRLNQANNKCNKNNMPLNGKKVYTNKNLKKRLPKANVKSNKVYTNKNKNKQKILAQTEKKLPNVEPIVIDSDDDCVMMV